MKEVYIITEQWVHSGDTGVAVFPFSDYDKGKAYYDNLIKGDKECGLSAHSFKNDDVEVYKEGFEQTDESGQGYLLEEVNAPDAEQCLHYWSWYEKGCYYDCHSDYKMEKFSFEEVEYQPIATSTTDAPKIQLFSNKNVHSGLYSYDEMKVMAILQEVKEGAKMDYEDLVAIAVAIYTHWVDGQDGSEDEKYKQYPWLEFISREEDGYIQAYAKRVAPEFIKIYKEVKHDR